MKKSPPCSASRKLPNESGQGGPSVSSRYCLSVLSAVISMNSTGPSASSAATDEHDVVRQVARGAAAPRGGGSVGRAHTPPRPRARARRRTQKSSAMNGHMTPSSIVATAAAWPGSDCTSPVL